MSKRATPVPAVVKWLLGPVLSVAGLLGVGVGFGLIELEPERVRAPLWVLGAVGVAFVSLGLNLLLEGMEALRRFRGWLGFAFLVSFASVFNWIAFGPGERQFSSRSSFGSGGVGVTTAAESGELGGRIAFGVFAVLMNLLIASPLILWLWRRGRAWLARDRSDAE
jgi:hypothetical protein